MADQHDDATQQLGPSNTHRTSHANHGRILSTEYIKWPPRSETLIVQEVLPNSQSGFQLKQAVFCQQFAGIEPRSRNKRLHSKDRRQQSCLGDLNTTQGELNDWIMHLTRNSHERSQLDHMRQISTTAKSFRLLHEHDSVRDGINNTSITTTKIHQEGLEIIASTLSNHIRHTPTLLETCHHSTEQFNCIIFSRKVLEIRLEARHQKVQQAQRGQHLVISQDHLIQISCILLRLAGTIDDSFR